jgi:hypothetical protein
MVFSVPTQVIFPQFKNFPSGVRQTISPDHVLLHARVGCQRVTHLNWPRQPLFTFRKQFHQILARVTPPAKNSEWPVAGEGRGFPPSVQGDAQKRSEQGNREKGREP